VFERDGFLHARIADICDEAGISHGSFYTYFVSKEEIFNHVVDTVELDLLHITAAPDTADPVERIRSANRQYLESFRDNADILRVIQQVSTFDDDVHSTRQQRQEDFARAIERRTREYQDDGRADAAIDPWFAANALGGMVASVAEQAFIHGPEVDIDHATEQLTRLWANALGMEVR
jgi:AcrR family transcriptional regulator